jgi:hypothetical protein
MNHAQTATIRQNCHQRRTRLEKLPSRLRRALNAPVRLDLRLDETLIHSRASSGDRRRGGFACLRSARGPHLGSKTQVDSSGKFAIFATIHLSQGFEENHWPCGKRIDCRQATLYAEPIERGAACVPHCIGRGLRGNNLRRGKTAPDGRSSSRRSRGDRRGLCRLSHAEEAQPRYA